MHIMNGIFVIMLCCIVICWFMQKYTYICWIHTDAINKDAIMIMTDVWINDAGRNDAWRKTQEDIFNNILPLTLLQGFERVVQVLHVRGSWRPNINCNFLTPLLWPSRCVFLVLLMLGSSPSGFPRALSVGCGFPYHIWSVAVWNSTGNCSATANCNCFFDSNSTELNNNS